jgi:hypothetical protein
MLAGNKLLSQNLSDSVLSVRLQLKPQKECYLDLIFENHSKDTVFLLSRFENFYLEWSTVSGIQINGYINRHIVGLNWGEMPIQRFIFSNGQTKISPNSSVSFEFDLRQFCYKSTDNREFGIDFDINFTYAIIRKNGNEVKNISTKTNYVKFEKSE